MKKQRKKIGLALGSGAVRGLVHVGVIKALKKHNIPIDYIAGSSVGAWVGAHYALFQDIKKLEETTVGKAKEKMFALFEPTMRGGLIKGKKMEALLSKWLNDKSFSDLKIPFYSVTTDLITGKSNVIDTGKLAPALRASMSIPTLFKPVDIEENFLVDGGLSNPVPVSVLKNTKADIIIAVNLDNSKNRSSLNSKSNSLSKITSRSLEIIRQHLADVSSQQADFIIEPNLNYELSSWSKYFKDNTGPKIMQMGVDETEKIINDIKKSL